ncbi:MAG TPA: twin-arginine translocase TatA/TatE family subunit [Candidatus Limnocylindrales bacterium]|nr:twin-arginine translocase TatA/TatE family subunit [Candidatus Limnocylindrales bacterium]
MLGRIGLWEIIGILAVIVLLFGSRKLPELARAIGKSVVELKEGLKGKPESNDSTPPDPEHRH